MRRTVSMLLVALIAALALGCEEANDRAAAPADAYERVYEGGPLTATVEIDDTTPTVADQVVLRVRTALAEGYTLRDPEWRDRFPEDLPVGEIDREEPVLDDRGRTVVERTIRLEPLAPGEYEIPTLAFAYRAGEGESGSVTTEPVPVTIESVLGGDAQAEVAPPKGVIEPVEPTPVWVWVAVGGGLAGIALAAAAVALLAKRRADRPAPPPPPAHVVALGALDDLLSRDLIERRAFKPFFAALSAILRRYIEDRFGLHAPTQTTEEFLREARGSGLFTDEQDRTLRAFLRSADEIKFAEGETTAAQARAAADTVRAFIEQTTPGDAPREGGLAS